MPDATSILFESPTRCALLTSSRHVNLDDEVLDVNALALALFGCRGMCGETRQLWARHRSFLTGNLIRHGHGVGDLKE